MNAMASKSLQDHATEQGVIVLSKNEHDDLTRAANKTAEDHAKKKVWYCSKLKIMICW